MAFLNGKMMNNTLQIIHLRAPGCWLSNACVVPTGNAPDLLILG
jgi:hypothetical protein